MSLVAATVGTTVVQSNSPDRSTIFPLVIAWSVPLPAVPAAAAAFDDGHAYVVLRDGQLVAIDLAGGESVWSVEQTTSLKPAAGGGAVFLAQADRIVALEAGNGDVRWTASLGSRASAPPLWDTGWLVVGVENGDVVALRARDGRELWRHRLDDTVAGAPVVSGERVYLPLKGGWLASLDLLTGEVLWIQSFGGEITRIHVVEEQLFAGATDNFFYSVALDDGAIRWRWRTGADVVGAAQVDQRHVYFAALDNLVRALDRRTGGQRWRRDLPMRPTMGVQLIGEVLVVSGLTPELVTFFAEDGEPAGSLTLTSEFGRPSQETDSAPVLGTTSDVASELGDQAAAAGDDDVAAEVGPQPAVDTPPVVDDAPTGATTLAAESEGTPTSIAELPAPGISSATEAVPADAAPSGGTAGTPTPGTEQPPAAVNPTDQMNLPVDPAAVAAAPTSAPTSFGRIPPGRAPGGTPEDSTALTAQLSGPLEYVELVPELGTSAVLMLMTSVTGENYLVALAPATGPPLVPLERLPGTVLPRGPLTGEPPLAPLDFMPGVAIPVRMPADGTSAAPVG